MPPRVLLASGTIAGLLDGDGSLALLARGEGERGRFVPRVAYVVRDDDPTPLLVDASLAALRGAPLGSVRHYPRQRELGWFVGAVPEIVELTGFLARAPLLSPRGWRQLTAIREAALLLADGRRRRSATEPLTVPELVRLRELHESIPRGAGGCDVPLTLPDVFVRVDDHYLGDYVAGLIAAEGSFEARSAGTHYHRPSLRLTQRDDNRRLLEGLRDRLGIGRVAPVPVGRGWPASQWVVDAAEDVAALAALLRRHPLPPGSPKAAQFEAWTELAAVREHLRTTRPRGALREAPELLRLVREIRDAKRYRPDPEALVRQALVAGTARRGSGRGAPTWLASGAARPAPGPASTP